MEIKKVNVNGKQYEFINEYVNTRHGFAHISRLCNQYGDVISENRCNYLNRTWECYRFQTSMRGCVSKLINRRVERSKDDFKAMHGYSKMTAKRNAEFEKEMEKDARLSELNKLYKSL